MTHLLPAGRASCQHSSPGAWQEGVWALPAAVLIKTGWEVPGCSPGCTTPRVPHWVGDGADQVPLSWLHVPQ